MDKENAEEKKTTAKRTRNRISEVSRIRLIRKMIIIQIIHLNNPNLANIIMKVSVTMMGAFILIASCIS